MSAVGEFDQTELDVVDRQRPAGQFVEMAQGGGGRSGGGAADAKALAAPSDYDVVGRLDLTQVFIEGAAEIRQLLVVERIEGEIEGSRLQDFILDTLAVRRAAYAASRH